MTSPREDLLARYGPNTLLSKISWAELPEDLRENCWDFIRVWQNDLDINELREISGLNDMSLSELLVYQASRPPEPLFTLHEAEVQELAQERIGRTVTEAETRQIIERLGRALVAFIEVLDSQEQGICGSPLI